MRECGRCNTHKSSPPIALWPHAPENAWYRVRAMRKSAAIKIRTPESKWKRGRTIFLKRGNIAAAGARKNSTPGRDGRRDGYESGIQIRAAPETKQTRTII